MLSSSLWIWKAGKAGKNEVLSFRKTFSSLGGKVTLYISAESDYVATLNGCLVDFSQLPGWPHEKYYDTLDLTPFCRAGENELLLTVRYEGLDTLCRIDDGPGLIFAVWEDGRLLAVSDEQTECGLHTGYRSGEGRLVTEQIGYALTLRRETPIAYAPAALCPRRCRLLPRPVEKCEILPLEEAREIAPGLYDLGRETAGYLTLSLRARSACRVTVTWGEHLTDGAIRHKIGIHDFSLDFDCAAGENDFTQYFIRLGARYLSLYTEGEVEGVRLAILPTLYPLSERPLPPLPPLDKRIYEVAVRTLRLCMNFHYEDCPWREQALYVVDSRNQMLSGYYAFRDTAFARENLLMMSRGVRDDGLLELTFPARNTPAIPFFAIMYPVLVWEYVEYTGDKTVLPEVMGVMRGIVEGLLRYRGQSGLIACLPSPYWNFYEWTDGSTRDEEIGSKGERPEEYDLILNCIFVYAAERLNELCRTVGQAPLDVDLAAHRTAIKETFSRPDGSFFLSTLQEDKASELGNALALLVGLGDERTVSHLLGGTLIPVTLSMSCFVYDALLAYDEEKYAPYVLADIRRKYKYMLDAGATSFWETLEGPAHHGLGSHCHGWSAIPLYYLNRLAPYLDAE